LGIATSANELVGQARGAHAASAIGEAWRQRFEVSVRGFDDEFIELAAGAFWRIWRSDSS
jgi:hypothetical protein